MKQAARIKPRAWMMIAETRKVMKALNGNSPEARALFVGGCVRNALLGEPVDDVDIATVLTPEDVFIVLKKAGIKAVPTGIAHGTITAVTNKKHFEITTLRRDVQTFGRRAVVAFTKDWKEDAARRDFTINTLLLDSGGRVYDPTGRGIKDLKARKVRFVGDPATRIAEDHLRILRFFRFYGRYGKGSPDRVALTACRKAAGSIKKLSRERVTQELFKILSLDKPGDVLGIMRENGILNYLYYKKFELKKFNKFCELQKKFKVKNDIGMLVALGTGLSAMRSVEKFLVLSKEQRKFYKAVEQVRKSIRGKNPCFQKIIYETEKSVLIQALLLRMAEEGETEILRKQLALAMRWKPLVFPLCGSDLIGAGVNPGPAFGKILAEIEEWWISKDFKPTKKQCLDYLHQHLAERF